MFNLAAVALTAVTVAHPVAAFSLTASPAVTTAKPGTVQIVSIKDSGRLPVTVNATLATIDHVGGNCGITNKAPSYASVQPAIIALQPGETRSVKVHIAHNAPRGAIAAEFTSQRSGKGNVKIRAGVASQIVVKAKVNKGHGHPCLAVHGTNPHHAVLASSDAPNPQTLAGIAALFLIVFGVAAEAIRRRRNRRKAQGVLTGKHRASADDSERWLP